MLTLTPVMLGVAWVMGKHKGKIDLRIEQIIEKNRNHYHSAKVHLSVLWHNQLQSRLQKEELHLEHNAMYMTICGHIHDHVWTHMVICMSTYGHML